MKCHSKAVQECKQKEETLSKSLGAFYVGLPIHTIVSESSLAFYVTSRCPCPVVGGETLIDGRYTHKEVTWNNRKILLNSNLVFYKGWFDKKKVTIHGKIFFKRTGDSFLTALLLRSY